MEYTRKMLILLAVVLIIVNSGDVVEGAQIPANPIPSYVPPGAEMLIQFKNVINGQTKAWPNFGVVTGDVTQVQGIKGNEKALYFNGKQQYINMGNHRGECLGNLEKCPNGYSLTLAIKADDFSSGDTFFYFSSGGQIDKSHGVAVFTKRGNLVVQASTRAKFWKLRTPKNAFKANEWSLIAVTWDKDNGLCVTINTAEEICTNDFDVRDFLEDPKYPDIYVGAPNHRPDENTNGRFAIDNLVSYNLVLTRQQILRMARIVVG